LDLRESNLRQSPIFAAEAVKAWSKSDLAFAVQRLEPGRFFSAGEGGSKLQRDFPRFSFEAQSASVGDLEFDSIFYDRQFRIGESPLFYDTRPLDLIYPADFKSSQMENNGFKIPDRKALNSIEAWRSIRALLLLFQKANISVIASFSNVPARDSRAPHFARGAEILWNFSDVRAFSVENSPRHYLNCAILYQMTDFRPTGICEGGCPTRGLTGRFGFRLL
jgi:hypothetical protein